MMICIQCGSWKGCNASAPSMGGTKRNVTTETILELLCFNNSIIICMLSKLPGYNQASQLRSEIYQRSAIILSYKHLNHCKDCSMHSFILSLRIIIIQMNRTMNEWITLVTRNVPCMLRFSRTIKRFKKASEWGRHTHSASPFHSKSTKLETWTS
jgi:hypothetical protein